MEKKSIQRKISQTILSKLTRKHKTPEDVSPLHKSKSESSFPIHVPDEVEETEYRSRETFVRCKSDPLPRRSIQYDRLESTLFSEWEHRKEENTLTILLCRPTSKMTMGIFPSGTLFEKVELDYARGCMFVYPEQQDIVSFNLKLSVST